ncbi:hypothetical protein GCM10023085_49480 [Actinomadura viridis]|uniref:XRE family transcriptional regulator n=1 Tax=Actinomadura viridis TaxID=58110 RepID=A0A931GLV1_9ACTN|nr:hypothetical protein [Actinomadura viridis]MBG6092463.1 hypothetical protein [Actinomadura viridis]
MARMLRAEATPEELPRIAHVSSLKDMIKQWEAGKWLPRPRYRVLYSRLTGIPETELFGTEWDTPPPLWIPTEVDGDFTPDDRERLDLAASRPERVDLVVVESLATILAAQRRTEDVIGAVPLIEPVRAQLAAIASMVAEARGSVRAPLVDVAAQWAQFAGWLHGSVDRHGDALDYLNTTLDWATENGDQAMVGTVMSWKGHIAARAGQLGNMIGLSRAGQRSRRGLGRVYDLYQEARGHALLGDAAAVDRLTSRAQEETTQWGNAEGRPWEYYYAAPGFFTLEHGLTYRILGRTDPDRNATAVELLSKGLEDLPKEMRRSDWAGDFSYELGRAYLQAGERRQAAEIADDLEELARRNRSDRLAGLAATLR